MIDINRILLADDVLNSIMGITNLHRLQPTLLLALLQALANSEKFHASEQFNISLPNPLTPALNVID